MAAAETAIGDDVMELEGNALFAGLSRDDTSDLRQKLVVRRYLAGTRIIAAEDRSSELYLILSGRVTVRSYADDGHEVAYIEMGAGAFFGELAAIDGQPRAADVVATADVVIATMRADALREAVIRHPRIGLNLSAHLVARVRELSGRVFEFSTLPSAQRIRRELLRLARDGQRDVNAVSIKPAPTHYEIAARTATHREAVSRELAALSARRILSTGRQVITVIDMPALERLAGS